MIAYTIQTNIFALIILLIVYKGSKNQIDRSNMKDRIFISILLTNALILVIDCFSIFLYDVPGDLIHVSQLVLKMIFYCLNPLPGFLWILYVYEFIFQNKKVFKKIFVVGSISIIINVALSIASVWRGYLFIIGDGNSYQRGSLFFLVPFFAFSYTIVAFIMIIINHKRLRRQEWLPLLIFAFPPIVGGLLQTFIYGMVTLWPSLSISLLIIYVFVQSKTVNTDSLTGLNNRRAFDNYLDNWKKLKDDNKKIAGFMMDMDHFKAINDTFGHQVGDKALIEMSRIIRESFRKHDFIARLGGDEFAAIIEVLNLQEIEIIKNRIYEKVKLFNDKNKDSFQLSISCGSDIFYPDKNDSLSGFFDELDKRMYEEKSSKKNTRK